VHYKLQRENGEIAEGPHTIKQIEVTTASMAQKIGISKNLSSLEKYISPTSSVA